MRTKIFPYRPNRIYFALFVASRILIPTVTTFVYYFVVLEEWKKDPEGDFQNIKEALVRYGRISQTESESFSYSNLKDDETDPQDVIDLVHRDLNLWGIFFRIGLPVIGVIALFIVFTLRVEIPGR